jgi:hypothetical protein
MHNEILDRLLLQLEGEFFAAERARRDKLSQWLGNIQHGQDSYPLLALRDLAGKIDGEARRLAGPQGINYLDKRNILIHNSSQGLLNELLIDEKLLEVSRNTLGRLSLSGDQANSLLGYNSTSRAAIVALAKNIIRGSISDGDDLWDENRINILFQENLDNINAIVGKTQNPWFRLTQPSRAENIEMARELAIYRPEKYHLLVLKTLSTLDLPMQQAEVARKILRAAHVQPAQIDELMDSDTAARRHILTVSKTVIKKTNAAATGKDAAAASLLVSAYDVPIQEAAQELIGIVGLANEPWWIRPRSTYDKLSKPNKEIALRCASALYDKDDDHNDYQDKLKETLASKQPGQYVSSTTVLYGIAAVLAPAMAGAALNVAPPLQMAYAVNPIGTAIATAGFCWLLYSKFHGADTTAPYVTMMQANPAICALAYGVDRLTDSLANHKLIATAAVLAAAYAYGGVAVPIVAMHASVLAASSGFGGTILKTIAARSYPKEGLSPALSI